MTTKRALIYALGAVAVISLALLLISVIDLGGLQTPVTLIFWISFVALVVLLYLEFRRSPGSEEIQVDGPPFARFLFNNRAAGLFWLPIRLFVGIEWLDAGLHKFSDPAWMQSGEALAGFWQRAVAIPDAPARPAITYEWYRDFLNLLLSNGAESWFTYVIVFGEIAIGLGLIFGALTGIAAFFGAFMNMSFLLAGSASTNPIMFTFAVGLMLAWKVAGYYGIDRWLLPRLGTPWHAGSLFRRPSAAEAGEAGSG